MEKTKRKKPKTVFLVFLLWFFILLPSIKVFLGNIIIKENQNRFFVETEENLSFLINNYNALFPDHFYEILSEWESSGNKWSSQWHLYKPYLEESIFEIDNMTVSSFNGVSKKTKNNNLQYIYFWQQIYQGVIESNLSRMENIVLGFSWFQEQNNLSDRELLEIIIDFIQQIPYEIPQNKYGLFTPYQILYTNTGDCDSKSVFAALLLKRLGYDAAVLLSEKYHHAMLGINVPSTGNYIEQNGKKYYFTEMTTRGWQIGEISAGCSDKKFWYITSI